MTDIPHTIIGNLTSDPELRFIQSGAAVVNFTVADTPRKFDKAKNEWVDLETIFTRCSLWREPAENVAESLTKGMRVIVTGVYRARSWEQNGEKRTSLELEVDEIGPSLRYATAQVARRNSKPSTALAASAGYEPSDPWASETAPFRP